jgi:RimJ/RimL family protein N-acetyltransferase
MLNSITIETDRLILRPVHMDDAKGMLAYRSDPIANQYQGWIPKTLSDVTEFIGKLSMTINMPGTWFQFAIVLKENNTLIGDIGVHFLDADNQVEIGYTLDKSFQRNGYATEAIRQVISYLFCELKKHRVIASIDPRNMHSIHLVERIGFRREAHFKESMWMHGAWADDLVYAILRKEWIC